MKRLFPPASVPLVICVLLSFAPLRVSAQEASPAGSGAEGNGAAGTGAQSAGTAGGNGAGAENAAAAGETGAGEEAAAQEAADGESSGAEAAGAGTDASAGAALVADETAAAADTELNYIEMDINTSTLAELAAWCRELGLNDGGSRAELAARLRAHYNITSSAAASGAGQRVITIESAKTTEYFTLEVVDEDYARLKGDVIISLKDGNAVHRIQAWEILYNRTRNVMSASGDVIYTKEDGNTVETFKGQSITVNLDNWSSIFMEGASEKSTAGKSSAYRFAGTVISRNSEEVTLLTDATITNPATTDSYWSLHASKLWLLPGNDWAIAHAVLRVGNIPVFYLPYFFYPADEIVFHPVLGYRSREGTFLQTTTYILGRPTSSALTENSITKIFGGDSDNSAKVREGVFLRTTDEKKYEPETIRLSLLLDAYTNLGLFLGSRVYLPAKGSFGETNIEAGFGLTRNIFFEGGNYSPFFGSDGESEWNSGSLLSFNIPLRFRFKVTGSYKIERGSLSWEIPYYSDPYVDRDFMRRSESLDWVSMLRDYVSSDFIDDTYLSSYEWKLSGSFSPDITALNPFVSSLSISSVSSTLLFNQRVTRNYTGPTSPPNADRAFFFPDRFTLFSISAAMAGTPYRTGAADPEPEEEETEETPADTLLPDLPVPPWETAGLEDTAAQVSSDAYSFAPPALDQRFTLPGSGGAQFSLDYRLTPTAASELQFRSNQSNWDEQEDINWTEVSTVLARFRSDGSVGFNVTHAGGGAYSASLRLSGTGSFQNYLYLNENAEEFQGSSAIKTARDRAYNETFFTSSLDLSTTLRPFFRDPVWSASSFQYGIRGLLGKTTVDTTTSDPDWNWNMGKWDKTDIDTHQVAMNLAANVMDYNQTFSLSAVLPPEDSSVAANATFRAWITETSIRGQVLFPFENETRKINPIYFTETLKFGTLGSFQQYIAFDPELGESTTLTSSLSFPGAGVTASYSALYAQPYQYNHNGSVDNNQPNGWVLMPDKGLFPHEFRLDYNHTFSRDSLWDKRMSFSLALTTGLAFDLQRYTNSRFVFSLGAKVAITNFLDLNISARSENVVMFKYFQSLPFFDLPTQLYPGQETNLFVDLLNSFRFDNDNLRRQSGFKLKTLDLSLVHHLGDWDARLTVKTTPYLPSGSRTYRFSNEISFIVQWIPISELKTQIDYVKDVLTVR